MDQAKYMLVEEFDQVFSLDLIKDDLIDSSLEKEVLEKIKERAEAKKSKDFVRADAIRDELLTKGIKLIDSRDGTTYELI